MKQGRRFWAAAAVMVGIMFLFTFTVGGCSRSAPAEKVSAINITYVKAPLNVPSIVEKQRQMFEQEFAKDGITVTSQEITSGAKQTEAVAAGALDFCNGLGGTSAILAAANGVDIKIISMYSRAPKAFMILVKSPDIRSVPDLKGKKVAGPKGTILHQLLVTALVKNSLRAEDVQFFNMDIPGAVAALMNGSVDAALVAGADANKAMSAGARLLTDGQGLVDGTVVVGVRGGFLKQHPDLVKRFKQVQLDSVAFIRQNPEEAYRLAANELGLTVDEVRQMYPWYDFDPQVKDSDIQELKATQDFLYNNGMLTKKIDIEGLVVKDQ
ncbi:MAG: aliphatic sulfonate ABC transporter substrate-binding protein [Firmicutes bacterium]|nr:aliphatic sulfonate ABC transporter substrate-binding protein [Bacillota bacterium]